MKFFQFKAQQSTTEGMITGGSEMTRAPGVGIWGGGGGLGQRKVPMLAVRGGGGLAALNCPP